MIKNQWSLVTRACNFQECGCKSNDLLKAARSHDCLTGEAAIFKFIHQVRWRMCQELQVIILENGLLRYSYGLLSLTISEAQPRIALVEVDGKDGG